MIAYLKQRGSVRLHRRSLRVNFVLFIACVNVENVLSIIRIRRQFNSDRQ